MISTPAQIQNVVSAFLSTSSMKAESWIQSWFQNEASIPASFQILQTSTDKNLIIFASMALKHHIQYKWDLMNPSTVQHIINIALQCIECIQFTQKDLSLLELVALICSKEQNYFNQLYNFSPNCLVVIFIFLFELESWTHGHFEMIFETLKVAELNENWLLLLTYCFRYFESFDLFSIFLPHISVSITQENLIPSVLTLYETALLSDFSNLSLSNRQFIKTLFEIVLQNKIKYFRVDLFYLVPSY